MLQQISVYTENRKGAAREIFHILAEAKINVLSLMNSDSGEFGTMRMVVSDSEKAKEKLKEKQMLCKIDHVLAIEVEDQPGELEHLLEEIETMNINISYMYVGYMRESKMPVIMIHCDELDVVESILKKKGYRAY